MGRFQGKVVIVTGASSGIGASTALAFAKEGAKLAICGRNKERLAKTAKQCEDVGAEVLEIIGDLTQFENLEAVINKTVNKFCAIDILINNAGYGKPIPIATMELEAYEDIFQANLRAPIFLIKYALPHLKKTKGCIVNVSSVISLRAQAGVVPYGMTKCALNYFTQGFSGECSQFGVRVNNVCPGATKTGFQSGIGMPEEAVKKFMEVMEKRHPLGLLEPEAISDGILFLASAPNITGVSLPIESGFLFHQ